MSRGCPGLACSPNGSRVLTSGRPHRVVEPPVAVQLGGSARWCLLISLATAALMALLARTAVIRIGPTPLAVEVFTVVLAPFMFGSTRVRIDENVTTG